MSLLAVGLSHRSAPVELLERLSVSADTVPKALHELRSGAHVAESLVLSTCNRVEVYADVTRFHGGVQEISDLFSSLSGVPLEEFSDHLYVHYEERAVQHVFSVAAGLESMVVGEGQILGQLRAAYRLAEEERAVGRALGSLLRHSLRVGKRARSESGIGRAGTSLVRVGLDMAESVTGPLTGRPALVVGAGSMAALAVSALHQLGAAEIVVANRTTGNAAALAGTLGGRAVGLDRLQDAIATADLVVSVTGASEVVVAADVVERALASRGDRGDRGDRELFFLDLAVPRDIEPAVGRLPGIRLADLDSLRAVLDGAEGGKDVEQVRRIVADEVADFLGAQRSVRVAPTVAALRARADELITAELTRLQGRLPGLAPHEQGEVGATVRRVVDKLLHAPTVRVKELAESPGGDHYAEALRELFGLDPQVPGAVATPDLPAPGDGVAS